MKHSYTELIVRQSEIRAEIDSARFDDGKEPKVLELLYKELAYVNSRLLAILRK